MKKIFYPVLSILVLGACSNETDELNELNLGNVNSKDYIYSPELNVNIEKRKDLLVFDSNEDFQKIVSQLGAYPINGVTLRYHQLENSNDDIIPAHDITLQDKDFCSLYDYYVEAMNEAESYYDRPGGYEEFKEKYSMLYFPEQGDDYSAYLPVSNKNIAKLLNSEGEVIINGNTVNLLDISSYEKLEKTGLTMPEENLNNLRNGNVGLEINQLSTKYNSRGDRKLWVNVHRKGFKLPDPSGLTVPYIQVEVCFRKKGFLRKWYNYSSETILRLRGSIFGVDSKGGFSSHDYIMNYSPVVRAEATVEYRGIPEKFDFLINFD